MIQLSFRNGYTIKNFQMSKKQSKYVGVIAPNRKSFEKWVSQNGMFGINYILIKNSISLMGMTFTKIEVSGEAPLMNNFKNLLIKAESRVESQKEIKGESILIKLIPIIKTIQSRYNELHSR